jgi:starvation-inducible DNA-binding protein
MDRNAERRQGSAAPHTRQRGHELQPFGSIIPMPIGLDRKVCEASIRLLNQILADTISLRDLYKKHHWQTTGPTFQMMHELFEKHYQEQAELADSIAERIQVLGGVSLAVDADIAEATRIERAPKDREPLPVQISRLVEAHEMVIVATREAAQETEDSHDLGTNDLLVSEVLRTNEFQVWYLSQHVVESPLVDVEQGETQARRRE